MRDGLKEKTPQKKQKTPFVFSKKSKKDNKKHGKTLSESEINRLSRLF